MSMTKEELMAKTNEMYEIVGGQFVRKTSSSHYKKGDIAGAIRKNDGFCIIRVGKEKHSAHKLVWLLGTGELPTGLLRHTDGNKLNNAIENIELAKKQTRKKTQTTNNKLREEMLVKMRATIAKGYDSLEYTVVNISGPNKVQLEELGYVLPYGVNYKWLVKNKDLIKIGSNTKIEVKCKCGDVRVTKAYRGDLECKSCSKRDDTLTEDERVDRRKVKGYMQWSYEVKERDNFTCVVCGNTKRKLHSHHLEAYRANKELRTEVSNGVCLCDKCHKEFHKRFGYGNNTAQQFEQFITEKDD